MEATINYSCQKCTVRHKLNPNFIVTYSINQTLYQNWYREPQETMPQVLEENTLKLAEGTTKGPETVQFHYDYEPWNHSYSSS